MTPEARSQKPEDGSRETMAGGPKTEARGQVRLSSVFRPLSSALRPLSSALCPLSSALCPPPSVLRPLSSALCPPSSVLRPPPSNPRSGQAAIELAVGLLLFLILLSGIIHVNRMARTSLFLHAVLRGDAGVQAMADTAMSVAPLDISDWQAGPDATRFTADDQPARSGAILPATLASLTGYSVKDPDDWGYVKDLSRLPASMVQLYASPLAATTLGFVHREETLHMTVDPVIRQLIYGKDKVAIKEEVWMPLMGGLY